MENLQNRPANLSWFVNSAVQLTKTRFRHLLAPRRGRTPRLGRFPEIPDLIPIIELYETICIWFASGAVGALGGTTALAAVKWMRDGFLKRDDRGVVKLIVLIEDCGETASGEKIGVIHRTVALSGAYSTPVVSDIRERVTVYHYRIWAAHGHQRHGVQPHQRLLPRRRRRAGVRQVHRGRPARGRY
jgi:hypothetical protein